MYITLCLKAFHALKSAAGNRKKPEYLEEIALIKKMRVDLETSERKIHFVRLVKLNLLSILDQ